MGAVRGLGSGCSKRAWQLLLQEGLATGTARGVGSDCNKRDWQ